MLQEEEKEKTSDDQEFKNLVSIEQPAMIISLDSIDEDGRKLLKKKSFTTQEINDLIETLLFPAQLAIGLTAATGASILSKNLNVIQKSIASTAAGAGGFALSFIIIAIAMEIWRKEKIRNKTNQELMRGYADGKLDWTNLSEQDQREIIGLVKLNIKQILGLATKLFFVAGVAFGTFSYLNASLPIDNSNFTQLAGKTGVLMLSTESILYNLAQRTGFPFSHTAYTNITLTFGGLVLAAHPVLNKAFGEWFINLFGIEDKDTKNEIQKAMSGFITASLLVLGYGIVRTAYSGITWKQNLQAINKGEETVGFFARTKNTLNNSLAYLSSKATNYFFRSPHKSAQPLNPQLLSPDISQEEKRNIPG